MKSRTRNLLAKAMPLMLAAAVAIQPAATALADGQNGEVPVQSHSGNIYALSPKGARGYIVPKPYKGKNAKKYEQIVAADMSVTGSGTGWHGKIGFSGMVGGHAISLGVQYDATNDNGHAGKPYIIVENVYREASSKEERTHTVYEGDSERYEREIEQYEWPKDIVIEPGQKVNLMLGASKKGYVDAYVDKRLVGRYHNPGIMDTSITKDDIPDYGNYYGDEEGSKAIDQIEMAIETYGDIRLEAAGRLQGDSVDARFSNVKVKTGNIRPDKGLEHPMDFPIGCLVCGLDPGFKVWAKRDQTARIAGTLKEIGDMNWDSGYNMASGIVTWSWLAGKILDTEDDYREKGWDLPNHS